MYKGCTGRQYKERYRGQYKTSNKYKEHEQSIMKHLSNTKNVNKDIIKFPRNTKNVSKDITWFLTHWKVNRGISSSVTTRKIYTRSQVRTIEDIYRKYIPP